MKQMCLKNQTRESSGKQFICCKAPCLCVHENIVDPTKEKLEGEATLEGFFRMCAFMESVSQLTINN